MFKTINNIKNIWYKYDFYIVLIFCVIFMILYAISRIGKKGTYSSLSPYGIIDLPKKSESREGRDSKGEIRCRECIENIFKRPFPKARPQFLNNPVTGGNFNLELDCYNHELRIAVEYNGAQHYKYIPYFHRNKEAFLNQKYRDYMKRTMCRENGIILIEVPYTVKYEDIEFYISNELKNIISKQERINNNLI